MKSKILIILLCVVAAIFLISGCFFYNTIYKTSPLAATYIAIMVSNYALVMFGLAVILHHDGSTPYNKCALYHGVLAGGISFFVFLLFACIIFYSEQNPNGGWLAMVLTDKAWLSNLLLPTIFSAILSYCLSLLSKSTH